MRLRTLMSLVVVVLMAFATSAALQQKPSQHKSDPISGEWEGLFKIGGGSAHAALNLKLDGDKVTGTVESQHTGPGTLSKGSYADDKLSFTMDFAAHESIVVTGVLKDGKLIGEIATEGMRGAWEATKKQAN